VGLEAPRALERSDHPDLLGGRPRQIGLMRVGEYTRSFVRGAPGKSSQHSMSYAGQIQH
jgi:hypothetical protein